MAFAIYLRREAFQPEPPQIIDKTVHDPNVRFTCVDFIPSVIKRSGAVISISHSVEYHSFSNMVEVANQWLEIHGRHWEVVNCETIIILFKYQDANGFYELKPNDCCFYIYGSEKNNVLRALRLWIRRRLEPEPDVEDGPSSSTQRIVFMDVLPKCRQEDGHQFEDLDDVLTRFNEHSQTAGLPGRIISIESVAYEANLEWEIDTERTLSTLSTKNVFILRIFLLATGERTYPRIGIEDQYPRLVTRATFFKRPKFEPFDQVIERGFAWLRDNPAKRFLNAQSIDVKMKSPTSINSRLMAFTEHGDYMRVFRVAYLEMDKLEREMVRDQPPLTMASRIFLPNHKSDTVADLKQRLSDWFNQFLEKNKVRQKRLDAKTSNGYQHQQASGFQYPRVMSAETVEVFAKDFRHTNDNRGWINIEKAANDDTFLANRFGHKNAYMLFSLRVYYDDPLTGTDSVTNMTVVSGTSSMATTSNATTIGTDSEWTLNAGDSRDSEDESSCYSQQPLMPKL